MRIRRFANWIRIAAALYLVISFANTYMMWGEMIEVENTIWFYKRILLFINQLMWDVLEALLIFGGAWVLESIAGMREQATHLISGSGEGGEA